MHRSHVIVRLVLGCSLVLGVMGQPSSIATAMAKATGLPQTSIAPPLAPDPVAPPLAPTYNDALPFDKPPTDENLTPTAVKEVGPEVIMPMPEGWGGGNQPTFDLPPDPWDDLPANPNPDAYERVVARSVFSGTSPLDDGMYTLNGERLEAIVTLQALTSTFDITISVLLPAELDYVGKGSADGEYVAGSHEIRWTKKTALVGLAAFRSYTVTVNQPNAPSQLFITTRISGPGVVSDVVRITPVWVGQSASQVVASNAETTMQASDRIQLRFPVGALNADTQIASIHHIPTVQDDGVAGQMQLPFSLKPDLQQFNTPVAITINLQGLYTAGMRQRNERPALFYAQPIGTQHRRDRLGVFGRVQHARHALGRGALQLRPSNRLADRVAEPLLGLPREH
ncbi:MAG: hypothetical protein HC853_06400 [Anaerolineae bacterium]|nr:hypothetical protein [Anaerolineae bacterium]